MVGDHCVNRAGLLPGQEKQTITRLAREGAVCVRPCHFGSPLLLRGTRAALLQGYLPTGENPLPLQSRS